MRRNVLTKQSTKAERIMAEILKDLHIPFRHRWLIQGKEIDFVIQNLCIEINGHEQNEHKNDFLISLGYKPIHYNNQDLLLHRNEIKTEILKLWQELNQQD